jgi:hypothetical protein
VMMQHDIPQMRQRRKRAPPGRGPRARVFE